MSDFLSSISVETLRRVQAVTGLAFSVFSGAHICNIYCAGISQQLFDSVQVRAEGSGGSPSPPSALTSTTSLVPSPLQLALRELYQARYVELVGFGTMLLHVGCGFQIAARRGSILPSKEANPWKGIHRVTGYLLVSSMGLHVLQMRVIPGLAGSRTDFAGVHYILVRERKTKKRTARERVGVEFVSAALIAITLPLFPNSTSKDTLAKVGNLGILGPPV